MNKFIALFGAVCLTACANVNVSDDFTVEKSFSYQLPSVPDGGVIPPYMETLTQSTPVDVSNVISKLNSLGTPSFTVYSMTIDANMGLGFVTHVEVDITQSNGQYLVVCNTDAPTSGLRVLFLPVIASGNDLLTYLGSGQVILSVSLTVSTASGEIPSGELDLNYYLGLNANESVSKSL